jgi:hypothetical protein
MRQAEGHNSLQSKNSRNGDAENSAQLDVKNFWKNASATVSLETRSVEDECIRGEDDDDIKNDNLSREENKEQIYLALPMCRRHFFIT